PARYPTVISGDAFCRLWTWISPQAPSRFRDRSRVRVLMPIFAHAWFVSLTFPLGLNLARLRSSTANFQSAAVAGLALRTLRHISGNFTYRFTRFMPLSSPHCAPAARSGPTSPGCWGDRPCTDRDSE